MYVALSVTAWRMVAVVVVSVSVVVADVDVEEDGCCRTFAVCGAISSVQFEVLSETRGRAALSASLGSWLSCEDIVLGLVYHNPVQCKFPVR